MRDLSFSRSDLSDFQDIITSKTHVVIYDKNIFFSSNFRKLTDLEGFSV